MDSSHEGGGVFGVSCCDAPPSFEVEEGVFDQMPDFVEVFVILALMLAVLFRRNDGGHALVFSLI